MKKFIIVLCIILAAGITLGITGAIIYAANGSNDMSKYTETANKTALDGVNSIKIKCTVESIEVTPVDGDEITFSYYEGDKLHHNLTVENGKLVFETENKMWAFWFWWGFNKESLTIKVGVPRAFAGDLELDASTGDIKVSDIAGVKEFDAEISTGVINVDGVKAESISLKSSTGAIKLKNSEASGDVKVKASTGKVVVDEVKAGAELGVEVSTGKVECNADAKDVKLKSSTGEIRFNLKNASVIFVKCTTGSVNGKIKGIKEEYGIDCSTTTGDKNLANQTGTTDKKLTVKTTTGSVSVYFE